MIKFFIFPASSSIDSCTHSYTWVICSGVLPETFNNKSLLSKELFYGFNPKQFEENQTENNEKESLQCQNKHFIKLSYQLRLNYFGYQHQVLTPTNSVNTFQTLNPLIMSSLVLKYNYHQWNAFQFIWMVQEKNLSIVEYMPCFFSFNTSGSLSTCLFYFSNINSASSPPCVGILSIDSPPSPLIVIYSFRM